MLACSGRLALGDFAGVALYPLRRDVEETGLVARPRRFSRTNHAPHKIFHEIVLEEEVLRDMGIRENHAARVNENPASGNRVERAAPERGAEDVLERGAGVLVNVGKGESGGHGSGRGRERGLLRRREERRRISWKLQVYSWKLRYGDRGKRFWSGKRFRLGRRRALC